MIRELFSVPVFEVRDCCEHVQEMALEAYNHAKEKKLFSSPWSDGKDFATTSDKQEDFLLRYPELRKTMMDYTQTYQSRVGYAKFGLDMFESTIIEQYPTHGMDWHDHQESHADVVGVYYIKATPESGALHLKNQLPHLYPFGKRWSAFCGRYYGFPVRTGSLIIFPAWMPHATGVNNTDDIRVSFSFKVRNLRRPEHAAA